MRMKSISLAGTLAVACVFLAAPRADARPKGGAKGGAEGVGPKERPFLLEKMDTDGDGQITAEEFTAGSEARMERMKEKRGEAFDGDRAQKRFDKMFSKLDTDGDGVLSEEEIEAAKEERASAAKDGGKKLGKKGADKGAEKGKGKDKDKEAKGKKKGGGKDKN